METKVYNILMVGVGGQGIILASDVIARAALYAGFDVKKSEVHGMSQRGGSVFSHIRFGAQVHSPLIAQGTADLLVSLEEMETLRWISYAGPKSKILVADTRILPAGVTAYPKGIEKELRKHFKDVLMIKTQDIVTATGHQKFVNIALTGLISCVVPIPMSSWETALQISVPAGTFNKNMTAFLAGKNILNPQRGRKL